MTDDMASPPERPESLTQALDSRRRDERLTVYLIAGEPSGDQLGARLMTALIERAATLGLEPPRFVGIGGEGMEAAGQASGFTSLFPMQELSIMGLVEILPHIPRLMRRIRETVADIGWQQPDLVVTIDSPGFTYRVARRLRQNYGRALPLVHYVAPTVWAWKPHRAARLAALYDHLLVLLPFEPPWFEQEGLETSFVGHPAVEQIADEGALSELRNTLGLEDGLPCLCVLPGSRKGEVLRLLPLFRQVATQLQQRVGGLQTLLPTVPGVADLVRRLAADWPGRLHIITQPEQRRAAFATADAALVASGTASVEVAAAGTPMVVAYQVNPITYRLLRRVVKVRFVSLINLVLDRPVIPERLQEACRPDILVDDMISLITADSPARQAQIEGLREGIALLQAGAQAPSQKAAEVILSLSGRDAV